MSVIPKYNGQRVYQNYDGEFKDDHWDVIVIGSGMGGMSCSAALAKLGHKVLLLEQHYIPGGYTHMFGRKGFKWDVGVHVMGEMKPHEIPAKVLKWLTDGRVKMEPVGDPFEYFDFPHGFDFTMPNDEHRFIADLKQRFPEEANKIERYWKLVKKVELASKAHFLCKSLPRWMDNVVHTIWYKWLFKHWWPKTVSEVLDEFDFSKNLKLALTSHWGYYGSVPSEATFGMHAFTHRHFCNGAYFPQGGGMMFAQEMLTTVLQNGGKILTKASVEEVLVENGKAVGVKMQDGKIIRAKKVVSAAGAKTTVNKLVPDIYQKTNWANSINNLKDSPAYLCLNLGFKGDIHKAGARPGNKWLYNVDNNDTLLWDVTNPAERPHLLYVSFPSLKDKEHEPGASMMHTGECVTFVDWDLFRKWEETNIDNREEDYKVLKQQIEERLLAELRIKIPEVMEHLVLSELSTPITSTYYARASKGAIYGLAATPERFTCKELRTRTPIKNLVMAGVDVSTIGVVGGMIGGLLAAATIDKRAYIRLV